MGGIPIRGHARGSAEAALATAKKRGCGRIDFTRDYLVALYNDAATLGIDCDVLVAQWSLETGDGTSSAWIEQGNPGGLGIFDDGTNLGLTFSPHNAARAHATHMARYLGATNVPADWIKTDVRWGAVADAGFVGSVRSTEDLGNGRWATDPDYASKLRSRYVAYWGEPVTAQEGSEHVDITFGRVPIYGFEDRFIASKREGFGWNNLGPRQIKFVTLHRMVGTLRGTDSYFRNPAISSYTDFGISTSLSDPGLTPGTIYLWNYPNGSRAPWASGPVSAPYGDGKAIVDKYGINAVNRDGISLEIGGTNEPIDDATWREIVWFVAYWADQCKVPYTNFPLNPATGISFVVWHNEFTNGTGKQCPFMWMRNQTGRLIQDVKVMLQHYQTSATTQPPVTSHEPVGDTFYKADKEVLARRAWNTAEPVVMTIPAGTVVQAVSPGVTQQGSGLTWIDVRGPAGTGWVPRDDFSETEKAAEQQPVWSPPMPVEALANANPDTVNDVVINDVVFQPVFDMFRVKQGEVAKQYQFAQPGNADVKVIGPDLKGGDELLGAFRFRVEGVDFLYAANHARIEYDKLERLDDKGQPVT